MELSSVQKDFSEHSNTGGLCRQMAEGISSNFHTHQAAQWFFVPWKDNKMFCNFFAKVDAIQIM